MNEQNEHSANDEKLPFDPRTLALGLWRRKWFLLVAVVLSCCLGVAAGLLFGKVSYEAETVLLFTATEGEMAGGVYSTPSLLTHMHLVKQVRHTAAVKEALGLEGSLESIASRCSASVQRDTSLLFIRGSGDSPGAASELVHAYREAFLETVADLRKSEALLAMEQCMEDLGRIAGELLLADQRLQRFSEDHGIVDLDEEARWLLEEYASVDLLLEEARIERSTTELQLAGLGGIMATLRERIAAEEVESADVEELGWAKIRTNRLREKIDASRAQRHNVALLEEREAEFERAKELYEEGLLAQSTLDKRRAAYRSQRAITIDTHDVEQWKEELERLDQTIVPQSAGGETASTPVLREMVLRSFDLQLLQTSLEDKVERIERALGKIRGQLDLLPGKQKEYVALSREVLAREREKLNIEERLGEAKALAERDTANFAVVSPGEPPAFPSLSTRRITAASVAFLGVTGAGGALLCFVLADRKVRNRRVFRLHFEEPVLGEIPLLPPSANNFHDAGAETFYDEFNVLKMALRQALPDSGARLMVVSATPGEGVSSIAANLARALGGSEERVLLVDCHAGGAQGGSLGNLLVPEDRPAAGLEAYLSSDVDSLEQVMWPTRISGLSYVPWFGRSDGGHLVASKKMTSMLDGASMEYSIVILDAPPLLTTADATLLARNVDAVLLVVDAAGPAIAEIRAAMTTLAVSNTPILGVVLNAVDPMYMEGTHHANPHDD